MTCLIIGTLVLLGMLAAAPIFHGRVPSSTGPFAKEGPVVSMRRRSAFAKRAFHLPGFLGVHLARGPQ
jgi:hypothetical protein